MLFRNLLYFRSLYESDGLSEITSPDGVTWSLFDIEYLYRAAMRRPAQIIPASTEARKVSVGHFVQHSSAWHEVVQVEPTKDGSRVLLTLANGKTKKALLDASVSVLTPQQRHCQEFDRSHPCLPVRQQQAIELFLVLNMPEEEAATTMGLSPTNPVGMYATSGLTRLLKMMDSGNLPRFVGDEPMFTVA